MVVLDATFPWWSSPCKKSKISIGYFQKYCWSKNSTIWLEERHNLPHPTISISLRCYLTLQKISPCEKSKISLIPSSDIDDYESFNLFGCEVHLSTSNQKWQSQFPPSLYLHTKRPRYQLTFSWYIDDQRMLQYDWMGGTTGHCLGAIRYLTHGSDIVSSCLFMQLEEIVTCVKKCGFCAKYF